MADHFSKCLKRKKGWGTQKKNPPKKKPKSQKRNVFVSETGGLLGKLNEGGNLLKKEVKGNGKNG